MIPDFNLDNFISTFVTKRTKSLLADDFLKGYTKRYDYTISRGGEKAKGRVNDCTTARLYEGEKRRWGDKRTVDEENSK